ncbi:hypothetical protein PQI07_27225 [Methylobacterium sp. 092160098-2]|uniref:hypothetical protein n=1 Tax=Methylobacterium sp. 092160098-2 TaxID=3025129 RepID=UPI002381A3BA|nr:hypothetical protein [Methylobacterium sp. 092160098-2]MDE4914367.1 hypothetical protein [Methylobacterium sp. 092160098-2]
MANEFQKLLLAAYPNQDMLNFDPTDERQVEDAVREGSTGDTLFDFLWKELADHSGDEVEHVLKSLDQAARDIQAVREAVVAAFDAPRAPSA